MAHGNGTTSKTLYEDLDALYAALPETEQERFAEVVGQLTSIVATERRQILTSTATRWRRNHGFPRFR
jgi:hypothetical protein